MGLWAKRACIERRQFLIQAASFPHWHGDCPFKGRGADEIAPLGFAEGFPILVFHQPFEIFSGHPRIVSLKVCVIPSK